jgi:glycine cleavage system regulatory protein
MPESLVLTVIGDDRPGLVEALSAAIADHDGNWVESRMAHLAGKFAGILRVDLPAERLDGLRRALAALETHGLRIVTEVGATTQRARRAVRLELVGADHRGIVREIAAVLARRGVNVEELRSECCDAPHSGQALFKVSADLLLPAEVSLDGLRGELESVANDLIVDVSLADAARQGS